MNTHELNSQNPFIRGYYIDTRLCDAIVKESEVNQDRFMSGIKEYTNSSLAQFSKSLHHSYVNELGKALGEYKTEFPAVDTNMATWTLHPETKVQRYAPGKGYKEWHAEQTGHHWSITRHLVYMTYLNDIQDEGGTEFFHQGITVTPEKGLTLIWPADWTHTHRGVVSETQVKYILTGWFVFDTSMWETNIAGLV